MMSKEKRRVPKLRFPGFTEDWEQRKLGALAEIVRGASPRPISDPKWFDNDSSVGWLRIADVTAQDGRIRYLEQKISELGQEKTRVIKTPHLLLSIAATVGKPVINYVPTGVHDGFLIFLNPKFNILYAFWWLEMFREKWNKYGQPGSQVNLNSDLVKNQVINIPNEKEQEKISSFLESLDKIITLHQRKLDNLKLKKKALLQKLFPRNGERYPELRFPGFTDAWEQRKLSDISTKVTRKNVNVHYTETLTNSAEQGIISQVDFFDKEISNKDNINGYYIVDNNDFIYNPRISTLAPVGPINRNKLNRTGIMSPLYTVFRSSNVDLGFLEWYFQSSHWHRYMKLKGDSGARADRIAIKDSTFFEMPIKIPVNIKEQVLIGETLEKFNQYITLHQRKLEHLQIQKKSLLQKLFV